MATTADTDEITRWNKAAAAFVDDEGGKGLALAEYDPDVPSEMECIFDALRVENIHAQRRLKAYIRELRDEQIIRKLLYS